VLWTPVAGDVLHRWISPLRYEANLAPAWLPSLVRAPRVWLPGAAALSAASLLVAAVLAAAIVAIVEMRLARVARAPTPALAPPRRPAGAVAAAAAWGLPAAMTAWAVILGVPSNVRDLAWKYGGLWLLVGPLPLAAAGAAAIALAFGAYGTLPEGEVARRREASAGLLFGVVLLAVSVAMLAAGREARG
jgi:hypothetical protein